MPEILSIIKNPNTLLRRQASEIKIDTLQDVVVQALIDDMIATMWEVDGVGIAAPQIGESIRIVIITSQTKALPLINPVVVGRSFRKEVMEEGCLSVPGLFGPVKRVTNVRCRAYDRNGKLLTFAAEGLTARIIQHEIDHLNGILFIDRAKWVAAVEPAARL